MILPTFLLPVFHDRFATREAADTCLAIVLQPIDERHVVDFRTNAEIWPQADRPLLGISREKLTAVSLALWEQIGIAR